MATPSLSEVTARIHELVAKYMGILGVRGALPDVKIRNNLGSKWLGRSTWTPSRPDTTVLELQQSIIWDADTLERVIAHEMVHHRDALVFATSANDIALLRLGIKPDSHGADFREGAERINAIMGPGFVTKLSDKEYKQVAPHKDYVVLITPLHNGKLGWNWAARIGPKAAGWVADRIARGSRLAHTSDVRWTRGRKIERFSAYSVPRDGEDAIALQALFDRAG